MFDLQNIKCNQFLQCLNKYLEITYCFALLFIPSDKNEFIFQNATFYSSVGDINDDINDDR